MYYWFPREEVFYNENMLDRIWDQTRLAGMIPISDEEYRLFYNQLRGESKIVKNDPQTNRPYITDNPFYMSKEKRDLLLESVELGQFISQTNNNVMTLMEEGQVDSYEYKDLVSRRSAARKRIKQIESIVGDR